MTNEEMKKKQDEFVSKKHKLEAKSASLLKSVIAALLDAKLTTTAAPLQEIQFELEVLDEEMGKLVIEHTDIFMDTLISRLRA